MTKISSTKVQGFWFFSVVITVGLFHNHLSGSEFNFAMSTVFGIFATANVAQKKVLGGK